MYAAERSCSSTFSSPALTHSTTAIFEIGPGRLPTYPGVPVSARVAWVLTVGKCQQEGFHRLAEDCISVGNGKEGIEGGTRGGRCCCQRFTVLAVDRPGAFLGFNQAAAEGTEMGNAPYLET